MRQSSFTLVGMGPYVGLTTSKGGTRRAFVIALVLVLIAWGAAELF
jgi:hypothetical protein